MKTMYGLTLAAVAVVLLLTSVPVLVSANDTDDRIESSAQKSHVFKAYLKDDDIKVESEDGVVTLTGTVADEAGKSLAQETVASLPGVKSVDNRLEIKGEQAAENSDAWVSMKVKATLLWHRNLSVGKTEVQVKDGVVTLGGEADSPAHKDLTTEYVKDVEGVKDVQNEMTVANTPPEKTIGEKIDDIGEKIDDASISALVKMTLLYHRSTRSIHATVETNNGMVTLGGKAGSSAEKELAGKYAKNVDGVNDVVNNMTVEKSKNN